MNSDLHPVGEGQEQAAVLTLEQSQQEVQEADNPREEDEQ